MLIKKCTGCDIEFKVKTPSQFKKYFHKSKTGLYGFCSCCKKCRKITNFKPIKCVMCPEIFTPTTIRQDTCSDYCKESKFKVLKRVRVKVKKKRNDLILEQQREKGFNKKRKYQDYEVNQILDLYYNQKVKIEVIANSLGRTTIAIQDKLKRLKDKNV